VAAANRQYKDIEGVLFTKDGKTLVAYPAGGKTGYTVPAGVTTIGEEAFSLCTSLTAVTIPAGVTSISSDAFSACWSLKVISVAAANRQYKDIDGVVFSKDGKTLLLYPKGGKTDYTVPAGVTDIGRAFALSRLTSVTIPKGVTSIDGGAFANCESLTSVTIPEGVTSIGEYAFLACGSLDLTIPASVASIGDYAFGGCSSLKPEVAADIEKRFGEGPLMGPW
jgi:hypothetical protein